ncbi:Fe-containing alcohol dehydrogenase [Thermococcus kodakarensis KOD1]|uniref:Fe-containing alcohol dehydrogenase n=1 Tax=Thermococcus kodakarensis (strain ATCC BAA-918 / JCM 12380 / KOD1) TaxID=69014 RepID=Q5JJB1_THEKO|nr:iron-containing alcohol dehydrogenase [Thermococcus kodakarensis]WCN29264.1 iron-containing alcohol dehydrogenase [Thermococcus kodakarensis]WCN31559.1 iron-containing alcohol dehydrogenase [Thermococcus kodakarensis]BAD85197.1 Fe-containing alcohol dehydrogenase [Thermococcus kodakarensis KOD1]
MFWLKTRISEGEDSLESLKDEAKDHERVLILASGSMKRHGFLSEAEDYVREAGAEVMSISGLPAEPSVEVIEEFLPKVREFGPDLLIAMGGGSVIDTTKALKVFYDAPELVFEEIAFINRFSRPKPVPKLKTPLIAIPSTSGAGSEVSAASVLKKNGIKYNIVTPEIAPEVAILDPRLPRTMPREVARNSGLDVLVHGIEAYTTKVAGPFSDAMAIRAIKTVFEWLPKSVEGDPEARARMHYAATMAGIAFLNARLGLAHAMSHKAAWVGPHGLLNAIFIPYVMEFNAERSEYARKRYAEIARELGLKSAEELIKAVRELNERLGVPKLSELVDEETFVERVEEMAEKAYRDGLIAFNPVEPKPEEIRELYLKALNAL